MKNINLEKRRNNILIATILTVFAYILSALLILVIRSMHFSLILEWSLIILLLLYIIFILPSLLIKLQDLVYKYLCKNIDIVEKNLTSTFTPIFLNTICIKKRAIPLHLQRKYYAKLEKNGEITIRIETDNCDEIFEETTSNYSMFLMLFRFTN